MRPLLVGVGAIALLVLGFALMFPQQFGSLSSANLAQLIWLMLAALLVGGGAFGINRFRGGGNLFSSAVFWAIAIAGIVVAYQVFVR
jgi:hypothetical protein